jgi:hypothetical protein
MSYKRPLYKIIAIDITGIGMIIGAGLFGWLPGPGGIPLLLGGLGLLAINHRWARNLLLKLKTRGLNIMDRIFVENKWVVIAYDIVALSLIITGVIVFYNQTRYFWLSFAIVCFTFGLGIFFSNRKRWQFFSKIGQKK